MLQYPIHVRLDARIDTREIGHAARARPKRHHAEQRVPLIGQCIAHERSAAISLACIHIRSALHAQLHRFANDDGRLRVGAEPSVC